METVDVLIVGGGPTGLTAACLLARYGVSFLLVEQNAGPSIHSKALVIQARTLELLEQLGLTESFVQEGEQAIALNMVVHGVRKARIPFSEIGEKHTRFPFFFILEQFKTEKLLLNCLQQTQHHPTWNTELVSFEQDAEGVIATIRSTQDNTTRQVRAQYLVAADGARSVVRHQLQLAFKGGTYENRFYVVDAQVCGDVPIVNREVSVCPSHDGFLGFFPMKGTNRRFRVVGILPEHLRDKTEVEFEDIRQEALRVGFSPRTGFDLKDCLWHSVYRLHHRYVEKMSVGRVFLAGDAAHIHSPAGGQGMNTGIQDAFNLIWKIVYVLRGWSHPSLLQTYHTERHPVAKTLVYTTDLGFGIATSKNILARFARMVLAPLFIPLALRIPFVRNLSFRMLSQIGISYAKSPLSRPTGTPKAKHLKVGLRVPDTNLHHGSRLHQQLEHGKWILLCVDQPELADTLRIEFSSRWQHLLECCSTSDAPRSGEEAKAFQAGEILLIRPDGYLGFSLHKNSPAGLTALEKYITTWCSA